MFVHDGRPAVEVLWWMKDMTTFNQLRKSWLFNRLFDLSLSLVGQTPLTPSTYSVSDSFIRCFHSWHIFVYSGLCLSIQVIVIRYQQAPVFNILCQPKACVNHRPDREAMGRSRWAIRRQDQDNFPKSSSALAC